MGSIPIHLRQNTMEHKQIVMAKARPAFSLNDLTGQDRQFPTGRPSLICFIKEDCQTCNLVAPILQAFQQRFADKADVWLLGQSLEGNRAFKVRHGLTMPILDESACETSFAWDFDIVPAVYWADDEGRSSDPVEGFVRAEWQSLESEICTKLDVAAADVAWADFPEWRPGCGSKHLDPAIHDRLAANALGSPMRARRIEVATSDDVAEFMYDQGFSDGLRNKRLIHPLREMERKSRVKHLQCLV